MTVICLNYVDPWMKEKMCEYCNVELTSVTMAKSHYRNLLFNLFILLFIFSILHFYYYYYYYYGPPASLEQARHT